jgi:phosphatidylglycerol---prolipoprotein diacylglyceryl transferase
MLPFIRIADFHVPLPFSVMGHDYFPLHVFGLLVASGVMIGSLLTVRRARLRGIDINEVNSFITWMLVAGFLGAHWLNDLMYEPQIIMKDPMRLLRIWESISSFGGFIGATVGILLWKYFEAIPAFQILGLPIPKFRRRKNPAPILALADLVMSVFPLAWVFGRSGCTVMHDHIGAVAEKASWLTVGAPSEDVGSLMRPYQGPPQFALVHGEFPRYDLGLLELGFTILLTVFVCATWSRKLPTGSYCTVAALSYAPVRFVMDYFRLPENDVRYGSWTPAQYMCLGLFGVGLYLAYFTYSLHKRGIDPAEYFYVDKPKKKRKKPAAEAPATG